MSTSPGAWTGGRAHARRASPRRRRRHRSAIGPLAAPIDPGLELFGPLMRCLAAFAVDRPVVIAAVAVDSAMWRSQASLVFVVGHHRADVRPASFFSAITRRAVLISSARTTAAPRRGRCQHPQAIALLFVVEMQSARSPGSLIARRRADDVLFSLAARQAATLHGPPTAARPPGGGNDTSDPRQHRQCP